MKALKWIVTVALVSGWSVVADAAEKKCDAEAKDCAKCEDKAACSAGEKVTFKVDGLSCSACENKLTKQLTALEGVKVDGVCAKSGTAKLTFDASKVKKEQLWTAIQTAGYKVSGEQVTLNVKGMACGACSSKVGKALTALEGVKAADVCHESQHAVITFDPNKVCRDKLTAAVTGVGFQVAADVPAAPAPAEAATQVN